MDSASVAAREAKTLRDKDTMEMMFSRSLQKSDITSFQLEEKQKLLALEDKIAWDRAAKTNASRTEIKAARAVFRIREHERDHLFGNMASEAVPLPDTRDMGGQFLTNKSRIEQSNIFRIAKRMPKGAHLHVHFNTEVSPGRLLERAEALGSKDGERLALFLRTNRPLLDDEACRNAEVVFECLKQDTSEAESSPFSSSYNPESPLKAFVKWGTFCNLYRQSRKCCSRDDCSHPRDWALSKLIVGEEEVYGSGQTLNGIWARFNQTTRGFKGLVNYESGLRQYVLDCIDNMIADNVMYAELRPMLMNTNIPSDDGLRVLKHSEQMQIIVEALDTKRAELAASGTTNKFPFGFKIIYCTPRSIAGEKMESELQMCIKLKLEFPDLICGFDLVGAEDRPNSIGYYQKQLIAFQRTCEDLGLEIPFLFHAGESLMDTGGSRDSTNSNLYDALLLKSKRIGHGVSLLRHPVLIQKFKEQDICIEVCPVSNEVLHLCRNVKEHPYPQLLAAGIPCTVNADNPVLFSSSLSHEFYQVMVGSFTMNLHGWRQLAEWSIDYSCLSQAEKRTARMILANEWEDFCTWIVEAYGEWTGE